jgi:hypothetical protein
VVSIHTIRNVSLLNFRHEDSERLVEVQGVASPGLIWQLKFISENIENQKRCEYGQLHSSIHRHLSLIKHPIGPYGEGVGISIWPGIYRFRAIGNIIAFGGSTGFGTHRVSS